ncbi:MAG: T9SS type A sorting domain-containing protein [Chitinophagales bacterium]
MKKMIPVLTLFCLLALSTTTMAQGVNIEDFPNTNFNDLDGDVHNMRQYLDEGKIVMMSFFSISEPSCQALMPHFENVYQEHGDPGNKTTVVLGIESMGTTSNEAAKQWEASYPVINTVAGCSDKPHCGTPRYYVVCPEETWIFIEGEGEAFENNVRTAIEQCQTFSLDASVYDMSVNNSNVVCDDQISPSVTLYNRGTSTLTSAEIVTTFNGTAVSTYTWTGNLAEFGTTAVDLPSFDAPESGVYDLNIEVMSPNGSADERLNNDNQSDMIIAIAAAERQDVTVEIDPDFYVDEISWEITQVNYDAPGDKITIATGDDYTNPVLFTESVCAQKETCYTFTIFDSEGDGLEMGGVAIRQGDMTLLSFTSEDHNSEKTSFDFCVDVEENTGSPLGIDVNSLQANVTVAPNPVKGMMYVDFGIAVQSDVVVSINNISGKTVQRQVFTANQQVSLDLSDLAGGMYFATIETNGEVATQKVIIAE